MLPILLGLGSALSIGVGDFVAGVASRRVPSMLVGFWTQAVGATMGVLFLLILRPHLTPGQLPISILAGLATGVGLALLYRAMSIGAISLVAPIVACAVVIPVIFAVLQGEALSRLAAVGVVAIVGGIVLASLQPAPVAGDPTDTGREGDRQAVILSIFAAIAFGAYYTLVDLAPQSGDWGALWTAGSARVASLGVQTALILLARQRFTWPGRYFPHLAAAGALDQLSLIFLGLGALTTAFGVVAALTGLYPVVTSLLGVLLLRERLTRLQASGAVLALAGVMLVSV